MDKPKVVAFLPAKGTSERVPSKNMKLLFGKPLFLHTLEKLCRCSFIDEVYLDSESDEILNYAKDTLHYYPLKRDSQLANNRTDGHQLFLNEVRQVDADIYIQILGTSPFIEQETIQKGVQVLLESNQYDSVVLVKTEKQYQWTANGPLYDKEHIPNSVDLPDTVVESMGLYIVRRDVALSTQRRFGDRVYMLQANPTEALDINQPEEFALAESVMAGKRLQEILRLNVLSRFINSAILSDILDEYQQKSVITGLSLNFPNKKVIGRANTLKIRKLREGEDYRGIYKGLETYCKIVPGDIIIVDNEEGDYAYFGGLNANLAIRSGAVATIVHGVTRDSAEVQSLDYPVFSKGYCSADVKRRATVESHNTPLTIQGVRIHPGDLIFGDIGGIAVVPRDLEEEVIGKAIMAVTKEKSILEKILGNWSEKSIFESEGEF